MRAFQCDQCGNLLFFENVQCLKCQAPLGFSPDVIDLCALESRGVGEWRGHTRQTKDRIFRQCQNQAEHQVCNWLVPAEDPNPLCQACRLNDIIPDLTVAGNLERWRKLEAAKRRLLYTLLHLGLPISGANHQQKPALRFKFMADPAGGPRILTGHSQGVITMNVAEADDPVREQNRVGLHEPYRTLLGHFRHEIAHFYWDQLIAGTPNAARFREVFGDETLEYAAALEKYYASGPPADWGLRHVSAYASAHPWEDWAETWAHYLHIQDTVETAASFGMRLQPNHPAASLMSARPEKVAEAEASFDHVLRHWLPITYAVNELNRGMGLPDVYPFVLSDCSVEKLRFVHEIVLQATAVPSKDATLELSS